MADSDTDTPPQKSDPIIQYLTLHLEPMVADQEYQWHH